MVVVVVVLALICVIALVAAVVARSRLAQQRVETAAASERANAAAAESVASAAALTETTTALDHANADARAAEDRAIAAEHIARLAAQQSRVDADVLWTLEQSRSERTWRFSVAPGPDHVSALRRAESHETRTLLVEALRVELEAAREEVGTIVELEADVPEGVTTAGAVLTLRAAQELLADVVRRSESTTLHVRSVGNDLEILVESFDESGDPVTARPLLLPPSPSIESIDGGVRLRHAVIDDSVGASVDRREGGDVEGETSDPGERGDPEPSELDVTMEILYPSDDGTGE